MPENVHYSLTFDAPPHLDDLTRETYNRAAHIAPGDFAVMDFSIAGADANGIINGGHLTLNAVKAWLLGLGKFTINPDMSVSVTATAATSATPEPVPTDADAEDAAATTAKKKAKS